MHHGGIPQTPLTKPTGIRLPVVLHAKLGRMALQQHRSFSNLVIYILQQHVKEVEIDEK
jgi:predicted HicB family RNase H-like nuclease